MCSKLEIPTKEEQLLSLRADKILKKLYKSKSNIELRAQPKLMKIAEDQEMSRLGLYNPHKAKRKRKT